MTMKDEDILKKIKKLQSTRGKIYAPLKYFRGLKTPRDVERRYVKMLKMSYAPFPTNKKIKTKKSSYTVAFRKKYPGATTLPQIAKVTGKPLRVLKTVYNRGLAAWRTGHRPGASQHAWAQARVYSFIMGGKADKGLQRRSNLVTRTR
jgi:hypothetical protein